MADAQIAIIDGDQTQVVLAPGENPAIVSSIPGPQGPAGAGVPLGGTTNQVLFKQSGTNYDTAWGAITSAMIGDLEIVNADVSASAAIAGTKISPNFGSQNVVTTGTSTAASFIPSSSTAPTNGLYLSAANSVALSTNGTGRLLINENGQIFVAATAVSGDSLNANGLRFAGGSIKQQSTVGFDFTQFYTSAGQASPDASIFIPSSNAFGIKTSANERLRITSTGQLSHIGAGSSGSPAVSFSGSAPSNSLVVDSLGRVSIGTSAPTGAVDVASGGLSLILGADANATTRTNAINKQTRIGSFHYTNAEEPVAIATTISTAAGGSLYFGGGTSSMNAATEIQFYTAANNTTTTGTARMTIDSSGRLGIGTQSPGAALHVENSGTDAARVRIGFDAARYYDIFRGNITNPGLLNFYGSQTTFTGYVFGGVDGERARIDTAGRLLVGTSSSMGAFYNDPSVAQHLFQLETTGFYASSFVSHGGTAPTGGCYLTVGRSRGTASGSKTLVASDDTLGVLSFQGADGNDFAGAASIGAFVDGTPGANDMPGRIVLSTTSDGASSPTERLRITNDGVLGYNQAAPVAVDATATLTVANLKTGIITSTTAAAVTMTLPTGTLTEGGFSGLYNNFTFEWTVINTGATNAVTVQGNTGHTLVGSGTVAAGVSGRFASRRTAANTFVTYRLS